MLWGRGYRSARFNFLENKKGRKREQTERHPQSGSGDLDTEVTPFVGMEEIE